MIINKAEAKYLGPTDVQNNEMGVLGTTRTEIMCSIILYILGHVKDVVFHVCSDHMIH